MPKKGGKGSGADLSKIVREFILKLESEYDLTREEMLMVHALFKQAILYEMIYSVVAEVNEGFEGKLNEVLRVVNKIEVVGGEPDVVEGVDYLG